MTKTKYAVDAATRRIRFKRKLKLNLWCWMFMSLAVGFYILFQGYPIICSIQYSLLDWSGMTSNATFIGLQNYKELMHDELFVHVCALYAETFKRECIDIINAINDESNRANLFKTYIESFEWRSKIYLSISDLLELCNEYFVEPAVLWNAFINSFKYMVMIVPLELAVSLFLAYLLNDEKMKGRGLYRTMYFVPVVTTASVVGIIMIFILGVQGPVNHLLVTLHILKNPINFLGNAKYALPTLVIISLWKDCGTYMIYWLAGLQGVSKDVYEAATIDGANRRQTFFHIVLPLIAPTGGIIAILCAINSLKVFDIVKTMTEGGPYYATDVIATYVYRTAFSSEIGMPRLGYASAAALFFGGAVIIIGILLNAMKDRLQKNVQ